MRYVVWAWLTWPMTHATWLMAHTTWQWHADVKIHIHIYWPHGTRFVSMTHIYMKHDSFIYEPWPLHIWTLAQILAPLPHSYMGHNSFKFETWLIHIWGITHLYLGHESFIFGAWRTHNMITYLGTTSSLLTRYENTFSQWLKMIPDDIV